MLKKNPNYKERKLEYKCDIFAASEKIVKKYISSYEIYICNEIKWIISEQYVI